MFVRIWRWLAEGARPKQIVWVFLSQQSWVVNWTIKSDCFVNGSKLCKSRGGRPGLPVSNSPYGLCGRNATLNEQSSKLCKSRGGRPGLPVPNSPCGLCGRKATLNLTNGWGELV